MRVCVTCVVESMVLEPWCEPVRCHVTSRVPETSIVRRAASRTDHVAPVLASLGAILGLEPQHPPLRLCHPRAHSVEIWSASCGWPCRRWIECKDGRSQAHYPPSRKRTGVPRMRAAPAVMQAAGTCIVEHQMQAKSIFQPAPHTRRLGGSFALPFVHDTTPSLASQLKRAVGTSGGWKCGQGLPSSQ